MQTYLHKQKDSSGRRSWKKTGIDDDDDDDDDDEMAVSYRPGCS